MAKKTEVSKAPEPTEMNPVLALAVADIDASSFPSIPNDVGSKALDYAAENNPYNTWKPVPNERKLVYLVGAEVVKLYVGTPQEREGIIAIFLDATTRKKVRAFMSDYVLKEFHERDVIKNRTLIAMTYEGKMPSKKTGMSDPNKWQRYYFKPEEVAKLLAK